jgi:peroxiredoxin
MHVSPLARAPGFSLVDQKGRVRTLADFLARGRLLLNFHRGTWCPNCRLQFAALADNIAAYTARGVQVVGVLAQNREAVRRYIEETGLPFDILIDERRDMIRAYGVWHRVGLDAWNIARPAVFLIDQDGAIRFSFISGHQREFPTQPEILQAADSMPIDSMPNAEC